METPGSQARTVSDFILSRSSETQTHGILRYISLNPMRSVVKEIQVFSSRYLT